MGAGLPARPVDGDRHISDGIDQLVAGARPRGAPHRPMPLVLSTTPYADDRGGWAFSSPVAVIC